LAAKFAKSGGSTDQNQATTAPASYDNNNDMDEDRRSEEEEEEGEGDDDDDINNNNDGNDIVVQQAPNMTKKDLIKAEKKKRKAEIREYMQQEIARKRELMENKRLEREEIEKERREAREEKQRRERRYQPTPTPVAPLPKAISDEEIFRYIQSRSSLISIGQLAKAFPSCGNIAARLQKGLQDRHGYVDAEGHIRLLSDDDFSSLAHIVESKGKISLGDLFKQFEASKSSWCMFLNVESVHTL